MTTDLSQTVKSALKSAYLSVADRFPILSFTFSGYRMYYPASSSIGRDMAAGRGWGVFMVPVVTELIESTTPVVVDVGTNIGSFLLQMYCAKPQAEFFCFEPSRRFLPFLKATIRSNHWSNVHLEPRIVSDRVEHLTLYNNVTTASVAIAKYDYHRFLFEQSSSESCTLDDFFRQAEQVDMIKVDTDGYDYKVLLGSRKLLEKHHPVLFFEFERSLLELAGHNPEDMLSYLDGLGYKLNVSFMPDGRKISLEENLHAIMDITQRETVPNFDILAVHSENRDQEECLRRLMTEH